MKNEDFGLILKSPRDFFKTTHIICVENIKT